MRKASVLAMVAFAIAGCGQASSNEAGDGVDWRDWCAQVETAAAEIMRSRQAGLPMSQMMEMVEADDSDGRLLADLVGMAFEHPRYNSDSVAKESVRNFADMAYRKCVVDSQGR